MQFGRAPEGRQEEHERRVMALEWQQETGAGGHDEVQVSRFNSEADWSSQVPFSFASGKSNNFAPAGDYRSPKSAAPSKQLKSYKSDHAKSMPAASISGALNLEVVLTWPGRPKCAHCHCRRPWWQEVHRGFIQGNFGSFAQVLNEWLNFSFTVVSLCMPSIQFTFSLRG